jgi:hypothetical protein
MQILMLLKYRWTEQNYTHLPWAQNAEEHVCCPAVEIEQSN